LTAINPCESRVIFYLSSRGTVNLESASKPFRLSLLAADTSTFLILTVHLTGRIADGLGALRERRQITFAESLLDVKTASSIGLKLEAVFNTGRLFIAGFAVNLLGDFLDLARLDSPVAHVVERCKGRRSVRIGFLGNGLLELQLVDS